MSNASDSFHPFGSEAAFQVISERLARVQGYAPRPEPESTQEQQPVSRESLNQFPSYAGA